MTAWVRTTSDRRAGLPTEPTTERNEDLVRRFAAAVNARDHDALAAFVAPGFTRPCPATPDVEVTSLADLRAFLEQDLAIFPDSVVTLERLIAEDAFVAFWAIYSATQTGRMGPFPPTGRRVSGPFAGYFRVEDGMLAELFVTWDNVDLLSQLGHMPAVGEAASAEPG